MSSSIPNPTTSNNKENNIETDHQQQAPFQQFQDERSNVAFALSFSGHHHASSLSPENQNQNDELTTKVKSTSALKQFRKRFRAIIFGPIVDLPFLVKKFCSSSSTSKNVNIRDEEVELKPTTITTTTEKKESESTDPNAEVVVSATRFSADDEGDQNTKKKEDQNNLQQQGEEKDMETVLNKSQIGHIAPFCLGDLLIISFTIVNCVLLAIYSPYTPRDAVSQYIRENTEQNQTTSNTMMKSINELLVQAPAAIIVNFERPFFATVLTYLCVSIYFIELLLRLLLIGPQWYYSGVWFPRLFDAVCTFVSFFSMCAELSGLFPTPSRWMGASALKLCLIPFIAIRAQIWPEGANQLLENIGGALRRSWPQFTFFFAFVASCALAFLGLLSGEMKERCVSRQWLNVSDCFVEYQRFNNQQDSTGHEMNNQTSNSNGDDFSATFLSQYPHCAAENSSNIAFLRTFNLSDNFLSDITNFVCGGTFDETVLGKEPSLACSTQQVCSTASKFEDRSGFQCPEEYGCVVVENLYQGVVGFDNYLQALFTTFVASSEKLWFILGPSAADSSMDVFFFVFVIFICLSVLILNVTIVTLCMEYEKSLSNTRRAEEERQKQKKRQDEIDVLRRKAKTDKHWGTLMTLISSSNSKQQQNEDNSSLENSRELQTSANNLHNNSTSLSTAILSTSSSPASKSRLLSESFTSGGGVISSTEQTPTKFKQKQLPPQPRFSIHPAVVDLVHFDVAFAIFSFLSAVCHILFLCLRRDDSDESIMHLLEVGDMIFLACLAVEIIFRVLGGAVHFFYSGSGLSDLAVIGFAVIGVPLNDPSFYATRVLRAVRAFSVYYGQIQPYLICHPRVCLKPWKIPHRWYRALSKSLLSTFILFLAILNLVLVGAICMLHGGGGWLCRLQVRIADDNVTSNGFDNSDLNQNQTEDSSMQKLLANEIRLVCPKANHESFGDSLLTVWQLVSGDDWDLLTYDVIRLIAHFYGFVNVVMYLIGFVVLTSVFSSSILAAYLNEAELDIEQEKDRMQKQRQEQLEIEQRRKEKALKAMRLARANANDEQQQKSTTTSSIVTIARTNDLMNTSNNDDDDNANNESNVNEEELLEQQRKRSQSVKIFDSLEFSHKNHLSVYKVRADRLLRRSVLADIGRSAESTFLISDLERQRQELSAKTRVDDDSQWTSENSVTMFRVGDEPEMTSASPSALRASSSTTTTSLVHKNTHLEVVSAAPPSSHTPMITTTNSNNNNNNNESSSPPQNPKTSFQQKVRTFMEYPATMIFFGGVTLMYVISQVIWNPIAPPDSTKGLVSFYLDLTARILCVVELILKLIAYGANPRDKHSYWKRSVWNIFESSITLIGFLFILLRITVPKSSSRIIIRTGDALFAFRPLTIVRHSATMQIVVRSLFRATSDLLEATFTILIFLFLIAFVGVQLFTGWMRICILDEGRGAQRYDLNIDECTAIGGEWKNPSNNFDQIVQGLWSVFILITRELWTHSMRRAMDYAGEGVAPQRNASYYSSIYFVVVSMISLIITNVFMAVLVESYNRCKRSAAAQVSLQTTREHNAWVRSERRLVHVLPPVAQQEILQQNGSSDSSSTLNNTNNNASFSSNNKRSRNNQSFTSSFSSTSPKLTNLSQLSSTDDDSQQYRTRQNASISVSTNSSNLSFLQRFRRDTFARFEDENDRSEGANGNDQYYNAPSSQYTFQCCIHTRHRLVHVAEDWRVKGFFSCASGYSVLLLLCITDPSPSWMQTFLNFNEFVLCGIFWSEVMLLVAGFGFRVYVRNAWNRVDLLSSMISLGMLVTRLVVDGFSTRYRTISWFLRLLRAVKLSKGTAFRTTFVRFGDTIRRLAGVLALMVFFFFGFSVVANRLFGRVVWGPVGTNAPNHQNAFRGAFLGCFYLLRLALGGSWPDVWWNLRNKAPNCSLDVGDCGPDTPLPELFFFVFILTFTFILKNLLVAVAVDVFASSGDYRSLLKVDAQTTTKLWMITQAGRQVVNPVQLKVLYTERVPVNAKVLRFIRSLPPGFPTCPIWSWENSLANIIDEENMKDRDQDDQTDQVPSASPASTNDDNLDEQEEENLDTAISLLRNNGNNNSQNVETPKKQKHLQPEQENKENEHPTAFKFREKPIAFKKRGLLEPALIIRVIEILFVLHQVRWRKNQEKKKNSPSVSKRESSITSGSFASGKMQQTVQKSTSFGSNPSSLSPKQRNAVKFADEKQNSNKTENKNKSPDPEKVVPVEEVEDKKQKAIALLDSIEEEAAASTTSSSAIPTMKSKSNSPIPAEDDDANPPPLPPSKNDEFSATKRQDSNNDKNDEKEEQEEDAKEQEDQYELSKPVLCTFSEVCDVLLHMAFMAPYVPEQRDRVFNTLDLDDIRIHSTEKDWEKATEFAFDLWLAECVASSWIARCLAKKVKKSQQKF